jgi:N-acylneuraminate cytidylyltransferase
MSLVKHHQIALIPARSGSKRLPGKNIKHLNGVPLIAYTIKSALNTNLFTEVIVSTDSQEIADIALHWGASVPALRPPEYARDSSPDIEWVSHCIENMVAIPRNLVECIAILRPTNPLRTSDTIVRAFNIFQEQSWADSLRAMEITNNHPGKMWRLGKNNQALPFLNQDSEIVPTHDRPTQSLEKLWIQNASLELIRFSALLKTTTISGKKILGFDMPSLQGFDINTQLDWDFLEYLISINPELLVKII